jgi:hypothetical protein
MRLTSGAQTRGAAENMHCREERKRRKKRKNVSRGDRRRGRGGITKIRQEGGRDGETEESG